MEEPIDRNLTFKLFALELIVIEMLTAIHLLRPDPVADAKKHRANLQKRLAETTLPLDETSSEYVKGGLAAAANKILEEVEDEVARKMGFHERSSERATVS